MGIEDIPKLESKNRLGHNVFEFIRKINNDSTVARKLLPICVSYTENEPIELIWYQNFSNLKKLHVFVGYRILTLVC